MPITKSNFATRPDIKHVTPEEIVPLATADASAVTLCEIEWLENYDGWTVGQKCVTYLTSANLIKRKGIRCNLHILAPQCPRKPEYVVYIRGDCAHLISSRLLELPPDKMCRPPRKDAVVVPPPLEAVEEPEVKPKRQYTRRKKDGE
jgi:hypothetical protein